MKSLVTRLREEKTLALKGGIYHKTQIAFAFDSNKIEGSTLSHEQTRMIYETKTLGGLGGSARLDDAVHADNHFRCFDYIIANADRVLDTKVLKDLHLILKSGTQDHRIEWFRVGDWKTHPNQVADMNTTPPEKVDTAICDLLSWYNNLKKVTIDDIIEFHWRFECIHPFQDGNGRVGRLVMFKECLRHGHIPFIIEDAKKDFYYRGLKEFATERGFLIDTCLSAQDVYKTWLEYFKIV